jgi:hypothetical protein
MKSLFHLFGFALGLESAHSQVTERELELLLRYSRGARTICEIGCYEGQRVLRLPGMPPEMFTRLTRFFLAGWVSVTRSGLHA